MLETIKFELQYRLKRPATWLYFIILFAMTFFAVTTDVVNIGGGVGKVKQNAPIVLTQMSLIMTAIGMLMISAIMGVPIVRDFQRNTASIIYTTPYKKWQYLGGRFIGSFLIVMFVFSGIMWGFFLGYLSPWAEADKLGPMIPTHYLYIYFAFILPSLFIMSSIFFMGGALSRKILIVYTQGALMLCLYLIAMNFTNDIENERIVSLIDPFCIGALNVETQYWTVDEQNNLLPPLTGLIFTNRLIWFGISILSLLVTYFFFSFTVVRDFSFRKKKTSSEQYTPSNAGLAIPQVTQNLGFSTQLGQVWDLSKLYFRSVIKSVPFIAIVLMGLGMLLINAQHFNQMYGTFMLPTTYSVVNLISSFNLFFLIIIVYFTGELIWQERDAKFNLIYDATPTKNWVGLVAKFLTMVSIFIILTFVLILAGMLIQASRGYYNFEFGVYLKSLFGDTIWTMLLLTLLAFFIHTIVNNKFLGHALIVAFFIGTLVLDQLGLEHSLFQFASADLGQFSDMNKFGHFVKPFSWYGFYWTAFSMLLFAGVVLFSVRGTETITKMRWRIAQLRFGKPILIFSLAAFGIFMLCGSFIFYNTNVLNTYRNSDQQEELFANYEKTLKQYEYLAQPKITATKVNVDIFPRKRSFNAKGYYTLKNKTNEVISQIHVQEAGDEQAILKELAFENGATIVETHKDFRYTIYQLNQPMQPNDEINMDFEVNFANNGFREGRGNIDVVGNGTFINNTYFPSFGYTPDGELSQDDDRKKYDLPEKERMLPQDDPRGLDMCLFGDDSDFIDFDITLSTTDDQIAIAPGYLQKSWNENGRKYFHYKMDKPMANFYSMVSASYVLKEDKWTRPNGEQVNLEIYYHPAHEYNIDRMMEGMKASLDYYSKNFSPFQFRQLRIMEFPRYRTFAQSFANTIPFSEGIGFMQDAKKGDVDMTFYVTCHEVAHQWWGHQVMEANVQGSAMLSETLSQYSALMVMKQEFNKEEMQKFLRHELDRYLMGRTTESKKEQPIKFTEGQSYIHYNKGSLLMYALQDYIGEDQVNAALRDYIAAHAFKEAPYPTTTDLIGHLKNYTPDSLQYLITDLFETITLFENKAEEATYQEISENEYEVTLKINAKKYRANELGEETETAVNDWADIGVYTKDEEGEDKLIYLEKHRIKTGEQTFTIKTNAKPTKAGVDPLNILIDRNPRDNTKKLTQSESS